VFLAILGISGLGVYVLPTVFLRFSRNLPDNYRYLAQEALRAGDTTAAIDITNRRLAKQFYDFEALRLRAEAYAAGGKPAQAADEMREALKRHKSATGRDVHALGFDEPLTYKKLADYLWAAGQYTSGGEMYRRALDAGATLQMEAVNTEGNAHDDAAMATALVHLKTRNQPGFDQAKAHLASEGVRKWLEVRWQEDAATSAGAAANLLHEALTEASKNSLLWLAAQNFADRNPNSDLPTSLTVTPREGVRVLDIRQFSLPPGASISSNSLVLARSGTATARFDTGVFKVNRLLLRVRATPAMGVWPVLLVTSGEAELARLYLDGTQPQEYVFKLWPAGAPKSLPLSLVFENDAFDPVTKADRNIVVDLLALQ